MLIGNRIIYDQDGEIVCQLGEMQGDVLPRKELARLSWVDIEYGEINFRTHRIVSINPSTGEPIIEEFSQFPRSE